MSDLWRYTCARCGGHHVRRLIKGGGWACQHHLNGYHRTPAVWDKKNGEWKHIGPEQDEGSWRKRAHVKVSEPDWIDI